MAKSDDHSPTSRDFFHFIDHLEWADKYVRSWPGWKHNLLGNATMEKPPTGYNETPRLFKKGETDDVHYPNGHPEINERFIAFGGEPENLDNAASIASAALVAAEQLYELDCTMSCAVDQLRDIAIELKRLRQVSSRRK